MPLPDLIGFEGHGEVVANFPNEGGGIGLFSLYFDLDGVFPLTKSSKLKLPSESYFLLSLNLSPFNHIKIF